MRAAERTCFRSAEPSSPGGGGRAHSDNLKFAVMNCSFYVCRKAYVSRGAALADHAFKTGLVNRDYSFLQSMYFLFVHIKAHDVIADFGQASACNETNIT